MQVHGDDMVDASDGEEVGEHPGSNGATMALLLGLTRVGEVPRLGQHATVIGSNKTGSIRHDRLKEMVSVGFIWGGIEQLIAYQ